jgi:hypothetical protein
MARVAVTDEERIEALEFRYNFMCKWNKFLPDKGSAEASIGDEFEPFTDYLIFKEDGILKGVVRLIKPNPKGFFLENFVNPRPYLSGIENVLELSEYITHPDYRNDKRVILGLVRGSFQHVQGGGYDAAVLICVQSIHRLARALGFTDTGLKFISGWQSEMTLFVLTDPELAYSGVSRYMERKRSSHESTVC